MIRLLIDFRILQSKELQCPTLLFSSELYFSYNQFLVYDADVGLPGLDWQEEDVHLGFARRTSVVNFGTLLESGMADLFVYLGEFAVGTYYDRIATVPFLVISGNVQIEGPEEFDGPKTILPIGHYRLTAAQRIIGEEFVDKKQEVIDLYFEPRTNYMVQNDVL